MKRLCAAITIPPLLVGACLDDDPGDPTSSIDEAEVMGTSSINMGEPFPFAHLPHDGGASC